MKRSFVAFHFALVQDVTVLRPLARLAASMPSLTIQFVISHKFDERDVDGRWRVEIDRLAGELHVTPFVYSSTFDCLLYLGAGSGMIIAGSESGVPAHAEAHELFRAAPSRFRTVTLQHGLECVGFLHNARHDETSGRSVSFAADIAVAWSAASRMHSVSSDERNKLYIAGPTTMIEAVNAAPVPAAELPGLVCENLHSVRFANANMQHSFLNTFLDFAGRLAMIDQQLVLRPHPAGRFMERGAIKLPKNVLLNTQPLYHLDLGSFAYAISAPSTVLFDFVLASVPVATWVDPTGAVDASNFTGLAQVSIAEDWWRFNWAARWDRAALLKYQANYLNSLSIPDDVRGRYVSLLALAN